jgi:hypothetical protein
MLKENKGISKDVHEKISLARNSLKMQVARLLQISCIVNYKVVIGQQAILLKKLFIYVFSFNFFPALLMKFGSIGKMKIRIQAGQM